MAAPSFTFEYDPPTIHHGSGAVESLRSALPDGDRSRALVVTGSTVGSTPAVMDPVRRGLGDSLVGVFDEASAGKYLRTAYDGAKQVREADADAVVGVGGGASLDMAKLVATLAGHDRPLSDVVEEILASGSMVVPDADARLPAVFAVPTTLPGADLSQIAGVKLTMDPEDTPRSEIPNGGVSDPRLMPAAVVHDPDLLATTPAGVLANSAMNGFNKGVEMLYTRRRTPVTDAAAMRGLRLLGSSLPAIGGDADAEDYSEMLQGVALAQYGISTPDAYRASVIHAFGHALSRNLDVQQGAAHGIATPHVLRFVFDRVDGRRDLLADGLGVRDAASLDDEATAAAVVSAVSETVDALDLPTRLRDVDGAKREQFPDLARAVLADSFMAAAPPGLDPDPADVEGVLEAMW